jgi:hypothetical protein
MKDGLYRVDKYDKCGGIVIENGKVTRCAPVFRAKLSYWLKFAVWVCK